MSYVVEDRRRIAPHAVVSRTGERRAVVPALEITLAHRGERACVGSRDISSRRESRILRRLRKTHVPRTDILTDVAPEQPVAHLRALSRVELSPMLDREIRDARARVEI